VASISKTRIASCLVKLVVLFLELPEGLALEDQEQSSFPLLVSFFFSFSTEIIIKLLPPN
jgi:hypothetical protein